MEGAAADRATPVVHDELTKVATLAPEPLSDAVLEIAGATKSEIADVVKAVVAIAAMREKWTETLSNAARAQTEALAALREEMRAITAAAQASAAAARASAAEAVADATRARADAARAQAAAAEAQAATAEARSAVATARAYADMAHAAVEFTSKAALRRLAVGYVHGAKDAAVQMATMSACGLTEEDLQCRDMLTMAGVEDADAKALREIVHAAGMSAYAGAAMGWARVRAPGNVAAGSGGGSNGEAGLVGACMSRVPGLAAIEAAATSAAQLALSKRVRKQDVLAAALVAAQYVTGGCTASEAAAHARDYIDRMPVCADASLRCQRIKPEVERLLGSWDAVAAALDSRIDCVSLVAEGIALVEKLGLPSVYFDHAALGGAPLEDYAVVICTDAAGVVNQGELQRVQAVLRRFYAAFAATYRRQARGAEQVAAAAAVEAGRAATEGNPDASESQASEIPH